MGLGFKEADFTFLGPTHFGPVTPGMPGTQARKSRRGKEKYGSLNLHMIQRASVSPNTLLPGSFTRFSADFSPEAPELKQAVRLTGKQYFF